jgi:hypothetical protein
MRRKTACSLVALTIVLVLVTTVCFTTAANYTLVGVKLGATADYKVSSSPFFAYNKTDILVSGIVGTTIYLNYTSTFPNGTESLIGTGLISGDISTYLTYVVASNLTVGDNLWKSGAPTINRTITMNAGGTSRLVNVANNITFFLGADYNLYYDKQTGLLVQGDFVGLFGWINYTLISTTAWSPPAPSAGISLTTVGLVGGVGIVALIVGFVVGRRGRK